MSLVLLSLEESGAWNTHLSRLPVEMQDVHWLPKYLRPFEACYTDQKVHLVVGDGVVQPILVQPESWVRNVYNFGGPLPVNKHVAQAWVHQWHAFKDDRGWRERTTLNPFTFKAQCQAAPTARYVKDTIFIDLTKPLELRVAMRHALRDITKYGAGIEQVELTSTNAEVFHAIHQRTMERVKAASHWFYPAGFFSELLRSLGPEHAALFLTKVNGKVESGCLLIHGFGRAYYHWAGNLLTYPRIGLNALMIVTSAEWARSKGYGVLHLGGGVRQGVRHDDGLYRFKAGFSKMRASVYIVEDQ